MPTYRRKIMTAQLPSTPCPPEMRDAMIRLAKESGRSLAELQRDAFELFLQETDRTTIYYDKKSINNQNNKPPAA